MNNCRVPPRIIEAQERYILEWPTKPSSNHDLRAGIFLDKNNHRLHRPVFGAVMEKEVCTITYILDGVL